MLTFVNQKRHNLAYDIARISNESSLKSSVSAFSGGLTSFQNSMISTPIKIQFGQCPPCNSFARTYQLIITCKKLKKHQLEKPVKTDILLAKFYFVDHC